MAAATVSGLTIRQQFFERKWCYRGAQVGAGNTAFITDTTRLKSLSLASTAFDGASIRIATGVHAGEQTAVDYLDQDNGNLYVTPPLSGALADGDNYEIWLKGIDPDDVDRLRDEALRKTCSMWRVQPLCLIDDGDMDSSAVTSWTAAGAATRTKSFSTFPDVHGRRQLNVVHTTAATDYVRTNSLFCQPGERFFLEIPVGAYVTATNAPATATVVAIDVTNANAVIPVGGIRQSHTGRGWGIISLLFSAPAGCYEIQLRLTSDTANSTTVWGPMNFNKRSKTRVSLPDRITSRKRVGTTFRLSDPNSAASEVNDSRYKLAELANVERKRVGSQVELWFNPPIENMPIWYHERGYFDALQTDYLTIAGRAAGDAATTDCPRDYIAAATAAALANLMKQAFPDDTYWKGAYMECETEFNYWENEYGPEPQYVEENEEPVHIPQLWV